MGYSASTVDSDFTIPAENVAAALESVRAEFDGYPDEATLADIIEDVTCFQECHESPEGNFVLGHHWDKFVDAVDELLGILGKFATEGSYVRFSGEDDCLFGYRVVDGSLRTESGRHVWDLDG